MEKMGTRRGASGAKRDAGEQVEGGKTAIVGTGGGFQREWKFFQMDRRSKNGRVGGE